jgi:hypothetical protein
MKKFTTYNEELLELLKWMDQEGVTLLPCEPYSKKPMIQISTHNVYRGITCPLNDTFHNPTPERLATIQKHWKFIKTFLGHKPVREYPFSASIDTNYPTHDKYTVACIDLDSDDFVEELLAESFFQDCPAVRGKKGIKLFFKLRIDDCDNRPGSIFYCNDKQPEKHIIEVFTKDRHALIFGYHPESSSSNPICYHFIRGFGNSIPLLTWNDVKGEISSFANEHGLEESRSSCNRTQIDKAGDQNDVENISKSVSCEYPPISFSVLNFLKPLRSITLGTNLHGAHPVHESTTGTNLEVDTVHNMWHCYRHKSGGGPLEAAAVGLGLIQCEDCRPGWRKENPEVFAELCDRLVKMGYHLPPSMKQSREINYCILDQGPITLSESIPKDFPDCPVILLKAPPRAGKTHSVVQEMTRYPRAAYISHSHSIVSHAIGIFNKLKQDHQTAVHLEGRERSCLNKQGHCNSCPYSLHHTKGEGSFKESVKKVLKEKGILTKDNVPAGFCPYQFLIQASWYASHIFTVIDLMWQVRGVDLIVLDEDPTIAKYYPPSCVLMEISHSYNGVYIRNNSGELKDNLQEYVEIVKKRSERKNPNRDPEYASAYQILLRALAILQQILDTIPRTDASLKDTERILSTLERIDHSLPEGNKILAYTIAKEIESSKGRIGTLSVYITPILFPFEKSRYRWFGKNPRKLFMIANEEHMILPPPPPRSKLLIIGDTRAEIFIRNLGWEYRVVKVDNFPYSDQFLLISVKTPKERRKTSTMLSIARALNPNPNLPHRIPCLLLTGSKNEQEQVGRLLGGNTHMSRDETRVGQEWNFGAGHTNIFYANSTIARGIDIEFYNIMVVYNSNFANPYWETGIQIAKSENDEEGWRRATYVYNAIQCDETTNCILRISPTAKNNDHRPRIVFISAEDLWKIKPNVAIDMNKYHLKEGKIPKSGLRYIADQFSVFINSPERRSESKYPNCPSNIIHDENKGSQSECDINTIIAAFESDAYRDSDSFFKVYEAEKRIVIVYLRSRMKIGVKSSIENVVKRVRERFPKTFNEVPDDALIEQIIHQLVAEGILSYESGVRGQQCIKLNEQAIYPQYEDYSTSSILTNTSGIVQ